MKKTNTPADPWSAMDAIVNATAEPTGPEWFTVKDYSARYKVALPTAWTRLTRADAMLERWTGYSPAARRRLSKFRVRPL